MIDAAGGSRRSRRADRRGLEQRINSLDGRITVLDKQIADADALVARTAAIPGAAVEIERIGEGQRFMTRVLTEGGGAGALSVGRAQAARIPAHRQGDARP